MPFRRQHKPKVHIHSPQIHQPDRGWSWVLVILFVIAVAVGGWKLYELGGKRAGFDRQKAVERADDIAAKMSEVEAQKDELRQQVAALEISSQVDKEAVKLLREELKELQDENLAFREEMKFLEGLVSDTTISGALRIDDFTLAPGTESRKFAYEVAASLTPASATEIKVQLSLSVHGKQDDKKSELKLTALDPEKRKKIEVSFKNIERFGGEIVLPEGFEPAEIEVELSVKGDKIRGEKKLYPWRPGAAE